MVLLAEPSQDEGRVMLWPVGRGECSNESHVNVARTAKVLDESSSDRTAGRDGKDWDEYWTRDQIKVHVQGLKGWETWLNGIGSLTSIPTDERGRRCKIS